MRLFLTFITAAFVFTVFDLIWLGPFMGPFYNGHLGPLKADPVLVLPAVLFYLFYLGFIVVVGVKQANDCTHAFKRGAGMGCFAYGTYELTNWAVIQDWPAAIVAVDMIWGVILTGSVACASRWVYERLGSNAEPGIDL